MTPCNRRGVEVRCGFFRCDSNRVIHPEPGIVAIATCGICPYRDLPNRESDRLVPLDARRARFTTPCAHRGAVLERGACNACGMKGQLFEVFACTVHAKCMVRRYRNDRPDLKVCFNCDDYQAD